SGTDGAGVTKVRSASAPSPGPGYGPGFPLARQGRLRRDRGSSSYPRRPAGPGSEGGIMSTDTTAAVSAREPELLGQIVVAIGGSAGIGLETARRARTEGAEVILTGRNPERLE